MEAARKLDCERDEAKGRKINEEVVAVTVSEQKIEQKVGAPQQYNIIPFSEGSLFTFERPVFRRQAFKRRMFRRLEVDSTRRMRDSLINYGRIPVIRDFVDDRAQHRLPSDYEVHYGGGTSTSVPLPILPNRMNRTLLRNDTPPAYIDPMSISSPRTVDLQQQFSNAHLDDFPNVSSYCQQLQMLVDRLSIDGVQVSEEQLVLQLISGLSSNYDSLANFFQQSNPLPSFYEARSRLILEETRTHKQLHIAATASDAALVTSTSEEASPSDISEETQSAVVHSTDNRLQSRVHSVADTHQHQHFVDEHAYGGGGTGPRSDRRGVQSQQYICEHAPLNSDFVHENTNGGQQTPIQIANSASTPEQKPKDGTTRGLKRGHGVSRALNVITGKLRHHFG